MTGKNFGDKVNLNMLIDYTIQQWRSFCFCIQFIWFWISFYIVMYINETLENLNCVKQWKLGQRLTPIKQIHIMEKVCNQVYQVCWAYKNTSVPSRRTRKWICMQTAWRYLWWWHRNVRTNQFIIYKRSRVNHAQSQCSFRTSLCWSESIDILLNIPQRRKQQTTLTFCATVILVDKIFLFYQLLPTSGYTVEKKSQWK